MLTSERLKRMREQLCWRRLPDGSARCDAAILLDEIGRLRSNYHRLLLAHLRVMKRDGDLYDAGGYKTAADLLRQMADQGLFEITVNGPENRIMGRLTSEGEKIMPAQSAEGA